MVADSEVCRDPEPLVGAVECWWTMLGRCSAETRLEVACELVYALVAAGVEESPAREVRLLDLSGHAVPVCLKETAMRPLGLREAVVVSLACSLAVHQVLRSGCQGVPTLSSSLPLASRPLVVCRSM